jgi:hypothetical protein
MTRLPGVVTLLSLVCGFAVALHGQQAERSVSGKLTFELIDEDTISREALDSFVTVRARQRGVCLSIAFNNPCQVRPTGRYRILADTITILLDHSPHLSPTAACPGAYKPEEFSAIIEPIPTGHYVAALQFAKAATLFPRRMLRRSFEVE